MKYLNVALLITFLFLPLYSSYQADDILGTWVTAEGKGHIEIYKKNNEYHGKLVWNKTPDKLDDNNPDPKKRDRKLRGIIILTHLKYAGDGEWEDGYIYDPEKGKTYNCEAKLDGIDKLNFRGYIGISLIGRTTTWTRKK